MGDLRPFQFYEPTTVGETANLLLRHSPKARLLAGGVNLVPCMRKKVITPDYVISLQQVPGLDRIEFDRTGGLRLGALATLYDVELSPDVKSKYPVLYEAIHQIASVPAKVMGTVVGNLCAATPATDPGTALFALDARVKIAGTKGERVIPIQDFFVCVGQTALQPGEMVTEIQVPAPKAKSGGAFINLRRNADDISKVAVAVMITVDGGTFKEARIALGSVAPTVIRASKCEASLKGKKVDARTIEAAAKLASEEAKPITDVRSTLEYRKEMVGVLTRRALEKALERAKA